MRLPSVRFEEVRGSAGVEFIDLRSPREFVRDHIPGSRSHPLLDDQGRAAVGLLYHKDSPRAALDHGLDLVEKGLGSLLGGILDREVSTLEWEEVFGALARRLKGGATAIKVEPATFPPSPDSLKVLSCWRGGMRSASVTALLSLMGEGPVAVLAGGYKSYRAWVMACMAALPQDIPLIVLRGPTGAGKTRALAALEEALPGSTLDLEGLAQHRSSILGDIGMNPVSQPAFETALAARLEEMAEPPWFIEGESRKVGDSQIPSPLFEAMGRGCQVRLDAPLEWRAATLGREYLSFPQARGEMAERLPFLEARLGKEWDGRLTRWLSDGKWREVAETLLEHYYDPLYSHHDAGRLVTETLRSDHSGLVESLISLREQGAAIAPPV